MMISPTDFLRAQAHHIQTNTPSKAMIELKLIQLEPGETVSNVQDQTAHIILSHTGEIIKDRGAVLGRLYIDQRESKKTQFMHRASVSILAGMMANPALEDRSSDGHPSSFMTEGDPMYGAMRATEMAEALWNHLQD